MKLKSIIATSLMALSLNSNAASLVASIPIEAFGQVYLYGRVFGRHEVYIYNETKNYQSYVINYMICPSKTECVVKKVLVSLAPASQFQKTYQSENTFIYRRTGNFTCEVRTTVQDDAGLQADKTAIGTIHIR